ncbi:MAG: response regulator transcription factor [Elusimicrobiota bacterium]
MKAKILIVDDEKNITQLMKLMVEAEGYEGLVAHDGKEALDKIKAEEIDLMLLDLMMPRVNGYEVLEKLRSWNKLKDLPVIVVSAMSQKNDKERAYELGASDYMVKGFKPAELLSNIKKYL